MDNRKTLGSLQIQHQAALVLIPSAEAANRTQQVAFAALNLDYRGAHLGQEHGPKEPAI